MVCRSTSRQKGKYFLTKPAPGHSCSGMETLANWWRPYLQLLDTIGYGAGQRGGAGADVVELAPACSTLASPVPGSSWWRWCPALDLKNRAKKRHFSFLRYLLRYFSDSTAKNLASMRVAARFLVPAPAPQHGITAFHDPSKPACLIGTAGFFLSHAVSLHPITALKFVGTFVGTGAGPVPGGITGRGPAGARQEPQAGWFKTFFDPAPPNGRTS